MALLTVPPLPPRRKKRRSKSSERPPPYPTITIEPKLRETSSMSHLNLIPPFPTTQIDPHYPPLYFTIDDYESVANPSKLLFHNFLNTMLSAEDEDGLIQVPTSTILPSDNNLMNKCNNEFNESVMNVECIKKQTGLNPSGPRKVRFNDEIQCSVIDDSVHEFEVCVERLWGSFGIKLEV